jgi:hypothetical protein
MKEDVIGGRGSFCHCYGRGKNSAQMIPGWPYSLVAALEPGRTSWVRLLDAIRLGPDDDLAAVTAAQVREVTGRIIAAGHRHHSDPDILVIFDAGYEPARLAWLLADLPVQVLGRLGANRVLRQPPPPRQPGQMGRPAAAVREHARVSGRTISAVVAQALEEFLDRGRRNHPRR